MGYDYWQKALALTGGKRAVTRDEMKSLGLIDEPQAGFFRKRTVRSGPFVPVAIWEADGAMVATVDGKPVPADEVWSYCCPHPVPEEWFRKRAAGEPWPDEDTAVTESFSPPPAQIGDNQGPVDEAEVLAGQIEAASANAAEYAVIESDEAAGKAQSVRSRLNDLGNDADKKREALVRPHLDAQRDVNGRWMPLVKGAKDAAEKLRLAIKAYENKKDAARRKAEADAAAKAAEEARKAEKAGKPAPAPAPAPPPPEAAPAPAQVRGASGRAASVKTIKVAKVIDQDAAYQSLRAHPEMVALIAALAQRALKAGMEHTLKGVEIVEEVDVR